MEKPKFVLAFLICILYSGDRLKVRKPKSYFFKVIKEKEMKRNNLLVLLLEQN